MDTKYNGWTNKATWLVKLWQDNDEGEQESWRDAALDAIQKDKDNAVSILADGMKDVYDGTNPIAGNSASVWSDLLSTALASVNWVEIAQAWIDDLEETK